jgi:hypothetical protein
MRDQRVETETIPKEDKINIEINHKIDRGIVLEIGRKNIVMINGSKECREGKEGKEGKEGIEVIEEIEIGITEKEIQGQEAMIEEVAIKIEIEIEIVIIIVIEIVKEKHKKCKKIHFSNKEDKYKK